MTAEEFSKYWDGWLSIAKIAALVVAAGWTYNQWTTTIFPKENYEQTVKAAKSRTDLDISLLNFNAGYFGASPEQKIVDAALAENEEIEGASASVHSIVAGEILLKNSRQFPVKYVVTKSDVFIGVFENAGDQPNWVSLPEVAIVDLFGESALEARTIESGGSNQLTFTRYFSLDWCCTSEFDSRPKPVRVQISLELVGVHPETSSDILGSKKTRVVGFLGFIHSDANFVEGEAKTASNQTGVRRYIASTPDANNGNNPYDQFTPIFDIDPTVQVPG